MLHRSSRILFGAVVAGLAAHAGAQAQEAVELEVVRLSPHAILVSPAGPQPTNTIAVETERGIVVIDPGISPIVAGAKRERIAEEFGRRDFAYVIDTHEHGDHTYGNQAFDDATIVGHAAVPLKMEAGEEQRERTRAQITAVLPHLRERLAGLDPGSEEASGLQETIAFYDALANGLGDGFRLTPPTETFGDRMTLELGDQSAELIWFGKAHSDTDILIFFPREGLLATGDLFFPDNDLYIDSERVPFLSRWAEKLDWILDPARDIRTIVPGHGDPLPLEEVARIRDFVAAERPGFDGKRSAFFAFRDVYEDEGVEAGLRAMDDLGSQPDAYFFLHPEFDSFVYGLMLEDRLDQAIPLFEKLAELFPEVPNAFDSLGEAYIRAERTEAAEAAFQRCLALDPDHENARRRLDEIRG